MKRPYLLLLLLMSFHISAQTTNPPAPLAIDPSTGKYATSGVISVDSKSKLQLMEGAYKWLTEVKFVNTLGSKGIVMDESVFGRIVVSQYYMSSPLTYNSKVRYTLILEFKDGRFRYEFTDLFYLAVAKRKDFESAETSEDKLLIGKFLIESNTYITGFISEISAYLANYNEDSSW
ncbi:MAG: DUF4468 domain-containing protein [Bacteroidales bacterium]